jgi:hypothetical protein
LAKKKNLATACTYACMYRSLCQLYQNMDGRYGPLGYVDEADKQNNALLRAFGGVMENASSS